MTEIFVSCSRGDHDRAKAIVERLETLGYSVAWDVADLEAIERELGGAQAVLAVWSAGARASPKLYAQAAHAFDAGKLVQLRLDRTLPPAPFDDLASADLSGERAEWGPLEDALARVVRGQAPEPERLRAATPPFLGAPRLLALAVFAALAAFAASVSAAGFGGVTLEQMRWVLIGAVCTGGLCAALSAYCLAAALRAGS